MSPALPVLPPTMHDLLRREALSERARAESNVPIAPRDDDPTP
jgi:hypothetical protein